MNQYSNQNQYWDSVSTDKEFSTPLQIDLFSSFVPVNARVLDHGCGYGRTLNELQQAGYTNLYGSDSSPKMIERAARELKNINLSVSNGEQIPFEDNFFDAVLLVAILTSVIEDSAQQKLLAEAARVLKPGGIIYINDFLLNQDERNITRYRQFEEQYGKYGVFQLPEGAVCRHHSLSWINDLLQDFQAITCREIVYNTMNGNQSNGFYYLGRKTSGQ